jgi:hypothetical protein
MEVLQGNAAGDAEGDDRPQTFPMTIPKPVIAALNGPAAGLGLVMALMCDLRFAAAGTKLTTAFARRGLIAEHGISWVLPRLVGSAHALDLLFSGRVVLAEEAAGMGLVNAVTGDMLLRMVAEGKLPAGKLATHRFRLDKDSFALRRNEIDATIGGRRTYATIGYLRLDRNIDPSIEDLRDREEIRFGGRVGFARYWSIFGSAVIDLTSAQEDPLSVADGFTPIRHRLGILYDDDCIELGVTWRRDYETSGDARRGNSFLIRVALRNLGR